MIFTSFDSIQSSCNIATMQCPRRGAALSIFPASVHQFYANILVFVTIYPFLYINDQFALTDSSLYFKHKMDVAGLIFEPHPWCSKDVKMIFWYFYWFQIFNDQCGSVLSISVAVLDSVYTIQSKGQLILKAIYTLLTSPKKQTDELVLFAFLLFMANKSNSFVHFLGESTACQSAFRFHLTFRKEENCFTHLPGLNAYW